MLANNFVFTKTTFNYYHDKKYIVFLRVQYKNSRMILNYYNLDSQRSVPPPKKRNTTDSAGKWRWCSFGNQLPLIQKRVKASSSTKKNLQL